MGKRSDVLLLLEPVEMAALMFEEKMGEGDDIPEGKHTATISYTLLRQFIGSVRALSEEMRREKNTGD